MRILHTADWHLGHRLYDRDRTPEHRAALAWLLATIKEEKVDLLVVAGDIFDTMNPSNTARGMYYDFLGQLRATGCRAAVIIGGNHDSPSLLDAPAEILRSLNLHVVGGARKDITEQVVRVDLGADPGKAQGRKRAGAKKGGEGAVMVAAVPYLRDRDLKYAVAGESPEDRKQRMRRAILEHYERIGEAVARLRTDESIPVLATGHLFAAGSEDAADKNTHIYLADKNNIEAGQFPAVFDYVALGHIHRAQRVGGREDVRYSGSPVPLTFGEATRPQSVVVFDLERAGQRVTVRQLTVPRFRELYSFRGTADEVLARVAALVLEAKALGGEGLAPWVEVRVESPHPLPLFRERLQAIIRPPVDSTADASTPEAEDLCLPEILRTSITRPEGGTATVASTTSELSELNPEEVFYQLCHGGSDEKRTDYPELLTSFRELRTWMQDQEALAE